MNSFNDQQDYLNRDLSESPDENLQESTQKMTKYLQPNISPGKISVTISPRNHSQNSRIGKLIIDDPYYYRLESMRDIDLQNVYSFVDNVPISKTKKNLNRDFSDCRLMAEVIKHYLPPQHKGLVEVHNYIDTLKVDLKKQNWAVLNRKVLSKLGPQAKFQFAESHIDAIVSSKQGAIERALLMVQESLAIFNWNPPPIPQAHFHLKTGKRLRHHSSALTQNGFYTFRQTSSSTKFLMTPILSDNRRKKLKVKKQPEQPIKIMTGSQRANELEFLKYQNDFEQNQKIQGSPQSEFKGSIQYRDLPRDVSIIDDHADKEVQTVLNVNNQETQTLDNESFIQYQMNMQLEQKNEQINQLQKALQAMQEKINQLQEDNKKLKQVEKFQDISQIRNTSKNSNYSQVNLIVASGLNDISIKEEIPPVVHYSHAISPETQENNPFADKSNDSFAQNLPRIRSPMFQQEKRNVKSRTSNASYLKNKKIANTSKNYDPNSKMPYYLQRDHALIEKMMANLK